MHTRKDDDSIITEGWIDKSCIMTIDAGASVMIVRPDTTGFPKRQLTRPYLMQVDSGETFPILKEAFIQSTLKWLLLKSGAGNDALHTHNAPVDMGCCVLTG
jgi:hypothetical protein